MYRVPNVIVGWHGNKASLVNSIFCTSITVPHTIAAENIGVTGTIEPNGLHIHIDVS